MAQQTYSLVVTGICAGQFVQNVFHYRFDPDGFTNRLLAAKGLVDGWIAALKHEVLLAMLPDAYEMKSVKARQTSNGGGPEWIDISLDGQTGTLGTGTSVPGVGPVIIWYTLGGPKKKGKTFLAGIANGNIGGDEIALSVVNELDSQANDFWPTFNVVGGGAVPALMVIAKSGDPETRYQVTFGKTSRYVGKQRRRQLPV